MRDRSLADQRGSVSRLISFTGGLVTARSPGSTGLSGTAELGRGGGEQRCSSCVDLQGRERVGFSASHAASLLGTFGKTPIIRSMLVYVYPARMRHARTR